MSLIDHMFTVFLVIALMIFVCIFAVVFIAMDTNKDFCESRGLTMIGSNAGSVITCHKIEGNKIVASPEFYVPKNILGGLK